MCSFIHDNVFCWNTCNKYQYDHGDNFLPMYTNHILINRYMLPGESVKLLKRKCLINGKWQMSIAGYPRESSKCPGGITWRRQDDHSLCANLHLVICEKSVEVNLSFSSPVANADVCLVVTYWNISCNLQRSCIWNNISVCVQNRKRENDNRKQEIFEKIW